MHSFTQLINKLPGNHDSQDIFFCRGCCTLNHEGHQCDDGGGGQGQCVRNAVPPRTRPPRVGLLIDLLLQLHGYVTTQIAATNSKKSGQPTAIDGNPVIFLMLHFVVRSALATIKAT